MLKSKKILASLMVGTMLAVAPVGMSLDNQLSVDYAVASAAKGGAKFSAPKPAPKPAAPKATAPSSKASDSKSVSGNGKDYKPSKDAKSLEKDAPGTNAAAKNSAGTAATAARSSSGWGSALRSMGILAGGMFLGHMLANLFGMGGVFGDVLGLLANILLVGAVFMLIRWAWRKFRGTSAPSSNGSWQSRSSEPIDVTPRDVQGKPMYQDISRISTGEYDAKSMADRYRNR